VEAPAARPRTPRLAVLLLLSGSLLISLLLAELALRVSGYRYAPLSIRGPAAEDRPDYRLFDDKSFGFDAELIWTPRKGHDIFNAEGYRGPILPAERKADERRILAVGDSNTLGWSGPDGANWPADLARLAQARGLPAQVANAGVWGYSSYQGVARLRQCLKLKPDVVLISFGSNDAHAVGVSDREYLSRAASRSSLATLARSRLGELLLSVRDRLATPADHTTLVRRVSLQEYRENLAAMIRLARENKAVAVLLTRPYVGEANHPLSWKNAAPDYNAATLETASAQHAPVIDVYTAFRDRRGYFADESHFTREGHQLAAELILSRLAPVIY
jgi:lysophospholipase L1-like esterase